jgi:anti-anti-sigma regulatory factor
MIKDAINYASLAQDAHLITIEGAYDLATAGDLASAVALRGVVIVDLTRASFIDSSVVATLLTPQNGRKVIVVSPAGSHPRRVLDLCGATGLIPVVEDVPAARAFWCPSTNSRSSPQAATDSM